MTTSILPVYHHINITAQPRAFRDVCYICFYINSDYESGWKIEYINLQSSYVSSGCIAYMGDSFKDLIINQGKITFQAIGVASKNKDDRNEFITSVLFGF